jgi:hypothetical protein
VPTPARLQALLELITEAGGATLDPAKDEQARFALTRGSTKEAAVYSTGRSVLHAGKAPAYDELSALIDRALEGLGGGDEGVPSAAGDANAAARHR